MKHHHIQGDGVRLHCITEGKGPPVILLHGFPDFWYSWRHQISALAASGLQVIAPDLRGYNLSDRPTGISSYRLEALVADVAAVATQFGAERPVVVGHDWGGIIAWYLAMHRPESLRGLAVLNAPHPVGFRRELCRPSTQILRSSYVAFFQLPKIPEAVLSAKDFAMLKRAWRSGPAESDADVEKYLAAFSDPGSLTAALNYYRAAARRPLPATEVIELPTLLLWGDQDPFLLPRLTEGLEPWIKQLEIVHLPQAGHWPHVSHADTVNRHLLDFIHRSVG